MNLLSEFKNAPAFLLRDAGHLFPHVLFPRLMHRHDTGISGRLFCQIQASLSDILRHSRRHVFCKIPAF